MKSLLAQCKEGLEEILISSFTSLKDSNVFTDIFFSFKDLSKSLKELLVSFRLQVFASLLIEKPFGEGR